MVIDCSKEAVRHHLHTACQLQHARQDHSPVVLGRPVRVQRLSVTGHMKPPARTRQHPARIEVIRGTGQIRLFLLNNKPAIA